MNDILHDMMREAKRLTQAGQLREATLVIQRALSGSKAPTVESAQAPQSASSASSIIDGIVLKRSVDGEERDDTRMGSSTVTATATTFTSAAAHASGEFLSGSHTHAGLTRAYKLYVPPHHAGRARPLVVMLHGCTQDADDFAAGTNMNVRAREQGFFVLYPEQSKDGNAQRCWNWFGRAHQQRGSGEPQLLADMTQSVMRAYGVDARRVYVAGLSAGGAMADILAAAYPDIFAAVGVHSGLPRGAASHVAGAFAAMKNGHPAALATAAISGARVPTIVFHGDADHTVHPNNGEQVIAALLRGVPSNAAKVEQGVASGGRGFTRTTYGADSGLALAEHWLVMGGGHAWSGGAAEGSYTDPKGPDATGEMLRFFFAHSLPAN